MIINELGAQLGYTLIAPMNSKTTYLIDNEGHVVKSWESDYTPAMCAYLLKDGTLLRPGNINNSEFRGPGTGGKIQRFTWDGELLWDYTLSKDRVHPHHDICPMPNGNVLVICWDKKTKEETLSAGRRVELVRGDFLPDCLLEVKPTGQTTGEIVWEWHAWDHLIQDTDSTKPNYGDVSDHPELIDVNFTNSFLENLLSDPQELAKLRSLGYVGGGGSGQPQGPPPGNDNGGNDSGPQDRGRRGGGRGFGGPGGPEADWMHTNSVDYNADLDQIMISLHEFSEVWIIDHSTTTAEAASHKGGKSGKGGDLLYRWGNPRAYRNGSNADQRLFAQHNAHWIPLGRPGAGHLLVFNNGNGRPDGRYSTADEIILPIDQHGLYQREEFMAFGPSSATWSYAAEDKTSLFSMMISGAQRLPNGNTLICSGAQKTLIEVTPEKKVVWRYVYPGASFGGPGGGGFELRNGVLFPEFVRRMLNFNDEQELAIDILQSDLDKKVKEELSEEQLKKFNEPIDFFALMQGGPRSMPESGGFLTPELVKSLQLTDKQLETLTAFESMLKKDVSEILTDEQKEQIENGRRFFAGGGPGGPGGFGPPQDGNRGPGGPPEGRGPDGGDDRGGRRGPGGGGPGGGFGGGGPGGIFRVYRYSADYPGLEGKTLPAGPLLTDVVSSQPEDRRR